MVDVNLFEALKTFHTYIFLTKLSMVVSKNLAMPRTCEDAASKISGFAG